MADPHRSPDPLPAPARALVRDQRARQWLSLSGPQRTVTAQSLDEVLPAVAAAERMARDGQLHVAGFLAFEAASAFDTALATGPPGWLPLAWFTGFAEAEAIAAPVVTDTPPALDWSPSLDGPAYRRALAEIRRLIEAGDTYQVNFTYRLQAALDTDRAADLMALFAAMSAQQPDGLGAFVETPDWAILCASHELFFEWQSPTIRSRPMKGTVARGADRAEDARRAAWLAGSAKNRAENLMITDMVRNDLGRIAATGTVRTPSLFELERYPTLWQMTSTVTAESTADLVGILRATFPAASITGAPKSRTMAIIRELETGPRQIYTGTIGYLRPDGSAQFNVAIRTVLVDRTTGVAEYGVGGGIVRDSDADEEYAETLTKALILARPLPAFQLLETLRWTPAEGYRRMPLHLQRLAAAADYFQYPFDANGVARAMAEAAVGFPPMARRIRLLLDRNGDFTLTDADLTPLPADYRVALAPHALPVENDAFVRHKTTNRVIYEDARRLAPEADDVLLWNARGELTESTIANLVVELDGEWVTPPVASGLLPGVCRRELLETGRIRERVILTRDLARCTGFALVNSLRGWWPVRLIDPLRQTR